MPIILFLLALFALPAGAQSLTDGRQLLYDSRSHTYLCTVPEAAFDDGRVGDFRCDTADVRFTFLPIVRIEGDFGYAYSEGSVSVIMPDEAESQHQLRAKLKWRGGTTNYGDKHKRNYSIKFLDGDGKKQDRKFFSLRNDNHWILDAAQVDFSRIRNRVATDLWNDFARKPYYSDREPKARTGTRGEFVELFLNDEYRGIYSMTECMDRSQLKLKKYDTDAEGNVTIRGQLWKSKGYKYSTFAGYADYDNTQENWGDCWTEYPDIEDVCPTDYYVFWDATRFITDCESEEFDRDKAKYFDIPVLQDYFLFCQVLNAIDNINGKNTFWACYDRTEDPMLTPAVWDLDCTVGGYFDPAVDNSPITLPTNPFMNGVKSCNLQRQFYIFDDYDFIDGVEQRYRDMRQSLFSTDALQARYNSVMDMLAKCGAYDRETARWSGDSDLAGRPLDFAAERKNINDWLKTRLDYLDNNFITSGITEPTVSKTETNGAVYNISGQRVADNYKGIMIINGKKVINR